MARIAERSVTEATRQEPQGARPHQTEPNPAVRSRARAAGWSRLRAEYAGAFTPQPCPNNVIRVTRSFEPRRVHPYPRVYQ